MEAYNNLLASSESWVAIAMLGFQSCFEIVSLYVKITGTDLILGYVDITF